MSNKRITKASTLGILGDICKNNFFFLKINVKTYSKRINRLAAQFSTWEKQVLSLT